MGPPWSPKQVPAVKAALPKGIFPDALDEGAIVLSVPMLSGLMWAPQTQPSFPTDSSDVMKAHLILFFEAAMSSQQCFGMLLSPGCLKSWAHNVLLGNLLSAIWWQDVLDVQGAQMMWLCDPLQTFFSALMFSWLMWFNHSSFTKELF